MGKISIEKFFWISCFLPFIQPFPFSSDLQLICPILALFICFRSDFIISKKTIPLILLLIILILSIIDPFKLYIYSTFFSKMNINKIIAIPIALFIYNSALSSFKYFRTTYVLIPTLAYFSAYIFRKLLPEVFLTTQDFFVNKTNFSGFDSFREIGLLATEPSFTAGCCATLIIFALWILRNFHLKDSRNNYDKKILLFSILLNLFLIISLKSLSGFVYLLLITICFIYPLLKYNFRQFIKLINLKFTNTFKNYLLVVIVPIITIMIGSLVFLINDTESNFRFVKLIKTLLEDPFNPFIISFDGGRYLSIVNNIKLFIDNPIFGVGLDYPNMIPIYNDGVFVDFNKGLISSLTYYIAASGLLSLILFSLIFYLSQAPIYAKLLAFTFMLFSFSLAFPCTWILLSLPSERKNNLQLN